MWRVSLLVLAYLLACSGHTDASVFEFGLPQQHGIENEIKKLVEEAITKIIDEVVPNSVQIAEERNLTKSFKVLGEKVELDLSFNGTQMTNLKSANTTFGNFTDTGVNCTILFPSTVLISNTSGHVCVGSDCQSEADQLTMATPLTLEAEVTYKLRKIGRLPVGLLGAPCLGPVEKTSLGTASVTGFGRFDKYVTEAANAAISEQNLFEKPLEEAINEVLHKLQKQCNFTSLD